MRLDEKIARACTIAGAGAIAVMMLATSWDIAARQIANAPLKGVVELVEVTVLISAMLGLPETFLLDEQIKVDLVDSLFPDWAVRALKAVGLVLTIGLLALLTVNVIRPMMDARMFGDLKYDLGLPVWPLYALIIIAFSLSILSALTVLWRLLGGRDG